MTDVALPNPYGFFLRCFASLMGRMNRAVEYRRERNNEATLLFAAILNRLDRMFIRMHRALLAYEPGRPNRRPSAACMEAAAAARLARAAALAAGRSSPPNKECERGSGIRLPGRFGWLSELMPEMEFATSEVRGILNEPVMIELLAHVPSAQRTMRSLCNMLGIGNFMVRPANEAALGRYVIGAGWQACPAAEGPGVRQNGRPAAPPPNRRQDE